MSYFANLVCDSTQAWRKFFFTPADPRPLGLIRIIVGSLVVWDLATLGPDLKDYLGSNGWIGPEALRQFLAQTSPGAWSFWLVVPDRWLMPVWVGCLIVATIFTLGLASPRVKIVATIRQPTQTGISQRSGTTSQNDHAPGEVWARNWRSASGPIQPLEPR